MLTCEFVDGASDLSGTVKTRIEAVAVRADEAARVHLPLAPEIQLQVGPSDHTIPSTGDTAYTVNPELIFWGYDASRGAADVAEDHLAKAYFHEAFHAARFRKLGHEAGLQRWSNVAIGEGLAVVFARDFADAHEEWCKYDPTVIEAWAVELLNAPWDEDWARWKLRHEDGRERIAFRVGVWLVDQIQAATGWSTTDMVWTPLETLEALPAVQRLFR